MQTFAINPLVGQRQRRLGWRGARRPKGRTVVHPFANEPGPVAALEEQVERAANVGRKRVCGLAVLVGGGVDSDEPTRLGGLVEGVVLAGAQLTVWLALGDVHPEQPSAIVECAARNARRPRALDPLVHACVPGVHLPVRFLDSVRSIPETMEPLARSQQLLEGCVRLAEHVGR